jgi:lipoprotein-anchoring transpeptidase ErfK/SrfK
MVLTASVLAPAAANAVCGKPGVSPSTAIKQDAAERALVATIDLSDQTMSVYVQGGLAHVWPVSTGVGGYATPTGEWRAQWLSPDHHSSKYGWAPMPWSVFFYGGYAIHGTTEVEDLGQPASHGCVRLHPDNARVFFDLVVEFGLSNTIVQIVE